MVEPRCHAAPGRLQKVDLTSSAQVVSLHSDLLGVHAPGDWKVRSGARLPEGFGQNPPLRSLESWWRRSALRVSRRKQELWTHADY